MNAVEPAFQLLRSLRNPIFSRLYAAQTVSLLGDSLTWVGLALLAFELGGANSASVLSGVLTVRVAAFVMIAPLAGAIADRGDRRQILAGSYLARMGIVGLMPFAHSIWQVCGLIFVLNLFNAVFTPTYRATIPLVTGEDEYPQAIALSSATGQLLGVVGPGIAGGLAVLLGTRQIFFLDAASFLIAALLIGTVPGQLTVAEARSAPTWQDITLGTRELFSQPALRYALGMQFFGAIAGAQILVNTVGYVQSTLHLSRLHYGWAMAMFGLGATLAAIAVGSLHRRHASIPLINSGALLITAALVPAHFVGIFPLMGLWLVAGVGESWINVPTQTLIAERIPSELQGRVYGAHFAWSHLWWLFAYPLAGWIGTCETVQFPPWLMIQSPFLSSSLLALIGVVMVQLTLSPKTPVTDE